jgi:hypothetical protein
MTWPPTVEDLRLDLKIDDVRDDVRLSAVLGAAIALVARLRRASFDFADDPLSPLPRPTEDIVLGTVRLAGRWHARGRSPDGLVVAGEFGTSRVPSFDSDIERLLGIGRYRGPVFA